MFSRLLPAVAVAAAVLAPPVVAADGFAFKDTAGKHLDVLLDGKVVARYMYAHDASTKETRDVTYKPYLHVFDPTGEYPITKGTGGQFPHHRGLFVGWNKIAFGGKSYDRWHMTGGDIVHEKFTNQVADATHAAFTSHTHWMQADGGKSIVDEERTTTIRKADAPARLLIELTTKLSAPNGEVKLDGDPEHAGVQFRPAAEVDGKETTYVFPGDKADPKKDTDYPWVGETFTLKGKPHSVVLFNDPANPKGTRFSAYRDYGRFGAFPVATVPAGGSVSLRYGFLVADGPMPPADKVQAQYDAAFLHTKPGATPAVTVKKADGAGTPKPKAANPKAPAPAK